MRSFGYNLIDILSVEDALNSGEDFQEFYFGATIWTLAEMQHNMEAKTMKQKYYVSKLIIVESNCDLSVN